MKATIASAVRRFAGARVLVLSPAPTHPQDYGNRKRIYRTCATLKEAGASITFLHYPVEAEWRNHVPLASRTRMHAAWDEYAEIPPVRPYHPPPENGQDHTIDEWWDDAIGNYLAWLFRVRDFDMFIVNYTWLSKALEFAPPGVLKILDTHDRFADRRETLAKMGIGAEFFHTTVDEEAIAFERADLVWAIKEEEKEVFETYSPQPVTAMPHLDPVETLASPPADEDGYLRVGIIGARNKLNISNFEAFMAEAAPVLRHYFAPVKFVIAGSMCDWLDPSHGPLVEAMGRVGDVRDFYRSVDLVTVPMTVSTGLKIKTSEALSFGMPIIATDHAFEGFAPAHPWHTLSGFAAMAKAIAEIGFDRSLLTELRRATVRAHELTEERVAVGWSETAETYQLARRDLAIVVDAGALQPSSASSIALRSLARYLGLLGSVTVIVTGGNIDALQAFELERASAEHSRLMIVDELVGDPARRAMLVEQGISVISTAEFRRIVRPRIVFADAGTANLSELVDDGVSLFFRPAVAALADGFDDAASKLAEIAPGVREIFIVGRYDDACKASLAGTVGGGSFLAPMIHRLSDIADIKPGSITPAPLLLHLLVRRMGPGTEAVIVFLETLGFEVYCVAAEASADGEGAAGGVDTSAVKAWADWIASRTTMPEVIVDLSQDRSEFQLGIEIAARMGIPCVSLRERFRHPSMVPDDASSEPASLGELAAVMARGDWRRFRDDQGRLESDDGWAALWRSMSAMLDAAPL